MAYILLYFPFLIAYAVSANPVLAYAIAWLGSVWIFYWSLSGKIKPIPADLKFIQQFFRPIILTQLIFAGYMAISSIFYFFQSMGYYYFEYNAYIATSAEQLQLIARGQSYYVLAHAAMVHGMLWFMHYPEKTTYSIQQGAVSAFMLKLTIAFTVLTFGLQYIPGLSQVQIKIANLSFVASVIALAYALPEKNTKVLLSALALFLLNMYHAFTSGWKEEILVPLIILGVLVFPLYRKTAMLLFPTAILLFLVYIPSYNNIVRKSTWFGETSADQAAEMAIAQIQSGEVDLMANNWAFLTGRISELSMFIKYIKQTPEVQDFYGFQIIDQAIMSLIPRVFYPEKPITEKLIMERVYRAGVADRASIVSAKPPPVVDAYLSGGIPAILIIFLLLGAFASWVSVQAENLFGGYLMGSGLVYTGLFQILWRGNSFEFMLNALFWSVILMYVLFWAGRQLGIIQLSNKNLIAQ